MKNTLHNLRLNPTPFELNIEGVVLKIDYYDKNDMRRSMRVMFVKDMSLERVAQAFIELGTELRAETTNA